MSDYTIVTLATTACFLAYLGMVVMVYREINKFREEGKQKTYTALIWTVTFIITIGFSGMYSLFKTGFAIVSSTL